jgi:hypothetical protein
MVFSFSFSLSRTAIYSEQSFRAQVQFAREVLGEENEAADMVNHLEWTRRQVEDLVAITDVPDYIHHVHHVHPAEESSGEIDLPGYDY